MDRSYTVSTEFEVTASSVSEAIDFFLDDVSDGNQQTRFCVNGKDYYRDGTRVQDQASGA